MATGAEDTVRSGPNPNEAEESEEIMTAVTTDTGIVIDVDWVREEVAALARAMDSDSPEAIDNSDTDFDNLLGLLEGTTLGVYAEAERQTIMDRYAGV